MPINWRDHIVSTPDILRVNHVLKAQGFQ